MKLVIYRYYYRIIDAIHRIQIFINRYNLIAHLFSFAIASLTFLLIYRNPSSFINYDGLNSSIELLTQILSILVGFLSLGISYYISSFDVSDSINNLRDQYRASIELMSNEWFNNSKPFKDKFVKSLFNWLKIENFNLYEITRYGKDYKFIYQPNSRGVSWFNLYKIRNDEDRRNVNAFTSMFEMFVCSFHSLIAIKNIRDSHCSLLSKKFASYGSICWIEKFEKSEIIKKGKLPETVTYEIAREIIELAVKSTHYMLEDFDEHNNNVNWKPETYGRFLYEYSAYLLWILFLINKINKLRISLADVRFPGMADIVNRKALLAADNELFINMRKKLIVDRKSTILVYGKIKYFEELKTSSIIGIGLSLAVLLSILLFLPIIKSCNPGNKLFYFALLYSTGIAAFIECSLFLLRIVLKNKKRDNNWFL